MKAYHVPSNTPLMVTFPNRALAREFPYRSRVCQMLHFPVPSRHSRYSYCMLDWCLGMMPAMSILMGRSQACKAQVQPSVSFTIFNLHCLITWIIWLQLQLRLYSALLWLHPCLFPSLAVSVSSRPAAESYTCTATILVSPCDCNNANLQSARGRCSAC